LLLRRPEERDAAAIIELANDRDIVRHLSRNPYQYNETRCAIFSRAGHRQ
jgi:hypothetical protein